MAAFPSTLLQSKPHAHSASEHCPLCEQPIPRGKAEEISGRLAAREREQSAELTLLLQQQFAAERETLRQQNEARLAAAREEAGTAARATLNAELAETQRARQAAEGQLKALKETQEAEVARRLQEAKEALENEKTTAVLAEKAKVLKLQSELQDMQRKLEGKSAHELGEGSEVDLFEQLRNAFEGDRIRRVAKGANGADVIHEIVHNGQPCGKIIYDAKNRNAWQNEFASKLRADKLAEGADHAILSSNKFPRDKSHVHFQDGVIVASPPRVLALVEILRGQVVRMHELRMSGEAREQKSAELYTFITSENFKQLLDTVEAQAAKMLELDAKEQEAHRRVWDNRAKLIRTVQKARCDLAFEVDRIIGTAGNGEPLDEPA